MTAGRDDTAPSLTRILTLITTYAAVLAAFGYMSLRAHYNHLGISDAGPLPIERYLMETYALVFHTVLYLFEGALVAGIVIGIPVTVVLMKRRKREDDIYSTSRIPWGHPAFPLAAIVLLAAAAALVLSKMSGATAVVVGHLDAANTVRSSWPFPLALLLSIGGLVAWPWTRRLGMRRDALPARLWAVAIAPWALLTLLIPIAYGQGFHPTKYPRAVATSTVVPGGTLCGLLMERGEKQVVLWSANDGIGILTVIPADSLQLLEVAAPADILQVARSAAILKQGHFPACR
jgi:hypothetical protein